MVAKGRARAPGQINAARGERDGNAVLTEAIVRDMVAEYARGDTQGAIARRYGVAQATVGLIVRGETWQHIPRPVMRVGRGGYASNGVHQRRTHGASPA